eukprot:m.175329 g.175329  ORF g.175329 m.175329 type:complete len:62 (-) comp14888_c1_seq2:863-1048(-)
MSDSSALRPPLATTDAWCWCVCVCVCVERGFVRKGANTHTKPNVFVERAVSSFCFMISIEG